MVQSGEEFFANLHKTAPKPEVTHLCFNAELIQAYKDAVEDLEEAVASTQTANTRMEGGATAPAVRKAAQKVKKLEEQIEAEQVRFEVGRIAQDKWQAIIDRNPPRPGNQMDAFAGYNRDAAVDAGIHECLVTPRFFDCVRDVCDHTDCGSWEQFVKTCNPSEWAELRRTFDEANGAVKETPKSRLASTVLANGGRGSRQRKTGE